MKRTFIFLLLVLVVDLRHAKQVDLEKMKESPVYNFKVQFEPQVSFLDNLDKLAGENTNFDIKDLIQNLNSVEEKKPQATNSPTDVDDFEFALPTVLPPIAPPLVITTLPTVSSTPPSTEMTTVFAPVTGPVTTDLPEVPTELPPSMPPPSEPIELPPSEPALVEAEESETEVVATTVTASRETRCEASGARRRRRRIWMDDIKSNSSSSIQPSASLPTSCLQPHVLDVSVPALQCWWAAVSVAVRCDVPPRVCVSASLPHAWAEWIQVAQVWSRGRRLQLQ